MSDQRPGDGPTSQEEFWASAFGHDYISRNQGSMLLASNVSLFARALRSCSRVDSCVEFGANIGMNLRALKQLYPGQEQFGVEINSLAAERLRSQIGEDAVFEGSIIDYAPSRVFDLALIKGVLIHIAPDQLTVVYDRIYRSSRQYILLAEYYNPSPIAVEYRGHMDKLFKRDFAGEFLDSFPDVQLVDYGFAYHRDTQHPQDDLTWFLLERRG